MLSECSFLPAGPKKSKIDRGLSYKVGCKARFTIAQCYSDPELCRVVISKCGISHVEHGKDWQPPASKPYLAKRKVAARLSEPMRQWVRNRLQLGVRPAAVFKEHTRQLAQNGRLADLETRDDCLSMQDIRNQLTQLGGELWKLAANEGEGVHLWTQQHPGVVFTYQLQEATPGTMSH